MLMVKFLQADLGFSSQGLECWVIIYDECVCKSHRTKDSKEKSGRHHAEEKGCVRGRAESTQEDAQTGHPDPVPAALPHARCSRPCSRHLYPRDAACCWNKGDAVPGRVISLNNKNTSNTGN